MPPFSGRRIHRPEVDRRQGQVACQAERPSQRQQEAISRLQVHRFGNALHGKPALAGDDRIALDAFVLGELERPFPTDIEAAAHRVAVVSEATARLRAGPSRHSWTIAKISLDSRA